MNGTARLWLAAFLLLGVLVGLLGSMVVVWQYQIDVEPQLIGLHFLALNAGYVIAAAAAQKLLRRFSPQSLAVGACCLAVASLVALSFSGPPVQVLVRLTVLGAAGVAAGTLATALLHALESGFEKAPVDMTNRAGLFFGCGCLLATLIVAFAYLAGLMQVETALLAVVPLMFLFFFITKKRSTEANRPRNHAEDTLRETLYDIRSIATVLFSLLLFFQFGNEWALAGWLPLFVIHKLGSNPVFAILILGGYFLALMLGRAGAQKLLPRINHRKLLIGSSAAAMCGCLLLSFTGSLAGVWMAVLMIGAGFAPIYPLVAEQLDDRFSYHPGFYNGAISIAMTGAMSAPWLLGFIASWFGMRYVMLLPALGSIVVLILALLIMLEAHLMADKNANRGRAAKAASGF